MALATVEDVATYLRRDLDAEDTATASQALDIISAAIKGYTGQHLELVTDDVVTLRYWGSGTFLTLPECPIVSVLSVINDGATLSAGIEPANYFIANDKMLYRYNGWGDVVVVTYTHGYDIIPEDIQGVCMEAAKRALENPAGLIREDLGGSASTSFQSAAQSLGFTGENKTMLDHYRPVVLA